MRRLARLVGGPLVLALAACCPTPKAPQPPRPPPAADPVPAPADLRDARETHLGRLVQLTNGGENAEAYWAFGGDRLIFQTTREGVACDQIMTMPTDGPSDPLLLSTGTGRTTCSYYFPGDQEYLYASTHALGPACPAPPDRSKGYVWALYDFDIYVNTVDGNRANPRKLFGAPGAYDAEATICGKDGSIIFTSDKDGDLELYRMDQDGGNVKRLTNSPGYDGGAFFSPDCSKIVWRASRPTGTELTDYQALLAEHLVRPTKLEIWVADADGSDARQVTYLDAASFAPFFHPSGERILFSSNAGDPKGREFDIWAIDTDGTDLERITYAEGFDGFPMFSPDGRHLAFSSNRGSPPPAPGSHNSDTNVFVADWIEHPPRVTTAGPADDAAQAVTYLADDAREGRGVGTLGLDDAQKWLTGQLRDLGAVGGLAGGEFLQPFEVTVAVARGSSTALAIDGAAVAADAFAPSPVSASTHVVGGTVYVGYGIVRKKGKDVKAIDDYKGKSVKGKVVVVRRFTPDGFSKPDVARYGDLNYKAVQARQHGAIGLLVVDQPAPGKSEAPLPTLLPRDGADAGLPVVVVQTAVGTALTKGTHKVDVTVQLDAVKATTHNVVAVLRGGAAAAGAPPLVVGAHLDHLGMGGPQTGALDTDLAVHNGADDNASGIAGLIEVARRLAPKAATLHRDVYLIGFSAEEMGILGSQHLVKHPPYAGAPVAMLNMDMIGRMRDNLVQVLGAESAAEWGALVPPLCAGERVSCQLAGSGYGPSDHMAFYSGGAPVLHFFTGGHLDYHRVTDDAPLINAAGIARVAAVVADVALALDAAPQLTYQKVAPPPSGGDIPMRGGSLGTIPAYGDDGKIPGVLLSDVVPDGPAAKAGLRKGDRLIKIGVTEVRSVEDLMLVLGEAAPGQQATIVFLRDGAQQSVKATFGAPRSRR
ncbi:MAG: M28 family peptidase [Myxococcales bacterium]|nr:M28 family peptidase [Myxococcales bacterium]